MGLVSEMIKEVIRYADVDREAFAKEIRAELEQRQTADFSAQKKRMAVCEKRIGELEILIAKIYEDNVLGKLPDKRYEMLSCQYEKEQEQLSQEMAGYKAAQDAYENDRKSAARFLALVERYENFDTLTTVMLNEFIEKIVVHERDRKGSIDTTQKIEIYYNLIGQFIPPSMQEKEPTPEELEEIRKKEARKDRLHRNYLRRKANGQQIQLVRDYADGCFVSAGMCADFSIHDRQDGNPHAHIMLIMRPLEQSGEWGAKCRKEYILDKDGNRIRKADGKYKSWRADTTDWNDRGKAEEWRKLWANYVNRSLAERGIHEKLDHRSYKRQGIEKIPSVHMGAAASQMERKGISTVRGMKNRRIMEQNRLLEETGRKIAGLCLYLKELNKQKEDEERGPALADLFDAAMNRALRDGKRGDAMAFADGAAFLRANGIESI